MTKTTQVSGNIATVDHAGTSHNGNPTYRITLDDGRSFLTETDSSVGYAATNYRPHSLRNPISPVILTIARGRITHMIRPDGSHA